MKQPNNIASLNDFKRDTATHLRRLRKTGSPCVLTINGKAALVVLDIKAFDRLANLADRADAIIGIQRGLDSFARGEGQPARHALERARAKLLASSRSSKKLNRTTKTTA